MPTEDLSYGVTAILLMGCLFTYFQSGSKIALVCFLLGTALMATVVFAKEPAQSLQDAKKEATEALVDVVAGIGAGRNPVASGIAAIEAGRHLSNALNHLREGDAEARRRRLESEGQPCDGSCATQQGRDQAYELDRSGP